MVMTPGQSTRPNTNEMIYFGRKISMKHTTPTTRYTRRRTISPTTNFCNVPICTTLPTKSVRRYRRRITSDEILETTKIAISAAELPSLQVSDAHEETPTYKTAKTNDTPASYTSDAATPPLPLALDEIPSSNTGSSTHETTLSTQRTRITTQLPFDTTHSTTSTTTYTYQTTLTSLTTLF